MVIIMLGDGLQAFEERRFETQGTAEGAIQT